MPATFYLNGGSNYVMDDTDKEITVYFDKNRDPDHAALLQDYEAANGPVTEQWVEPVYPDPSPGDIVAEFFGTPEMLHAAVKYAEAHVEHGAWDSTVQYHPGDVVTHNGYVWKATSNNTGNEPDDVPGDWEKVS